MPALCFAVVSAWAEDPVVAELREQISALDRALLETVNRRIELVARLRDHKIERGYPLVDRERERALVDELARMNTGPLSREGLDDLFAGLLELVKREVALGEPPGPTG